MKKVIVCAALAAAALMCFGCSKKGGASAAGGERKAEDQITVRFLTDSTGIDDKSFNAAAWRGILEFYGDTWQDTKLRGKYYDVVTAQTQDMFVPCMKQAADEGYDLIIATSFNFADALIEISPEYPNQKFLIIDVDWVLLPNVLSVVFAEHEGSYLVGVAAALKSRADGISNPRFGFIGGVPDATITKFEVGYVQGIHAILPDAPILDYYVNSWGEPALAKTQAKAWYDSGVYAIYSAAGSSGNGTIAQAKEYRSQGKNVWAIGVDSDQYDEGLYTATDSAVLTSMIKRVEAGVLYGLSAVQQGTYKGELITLDTKTGGVGYSTTNQAMTPDIVGRLEEAKTKIISGEVQIAATHAAAKALPGFPQDLKALDN